MRHFNYLLDESRYHKVCRRLNYQYDQELKGILESFQLGERRHINFDLNGKKVTLIYPNQDKEYL